MFTTAQLSQPTPLYTYLSDIICEGDLCWKGGGQAGVAQAGVDSSLLGQVVGRGTSKPKQEDGGRGRRNITRWRCGELSSQYVKLRLYIWEAGELAVLFEEFQLFEHISSGKILRD